MTESSGSPEDRQAQLREIEEAQAAAEVALERCRAAAEKLGSAKAWGTYDTWFGGGLFASMIKHDRIDQAQALLRSVDEALGTLRKELADVGMSAVGEIGVSATLRALDVWFDNVFSDAMTQSRLREADQRLADIGRVVIDLRAELTRRHRRLVETSD